MQAKIHFQFCMQKANIVVIGIGGLIGVKHSVDLVGIELKYLVEGLTLILMQLFQHP